LFGRARAAGITTSLDLAVLDPASPAARLDWPALLRRVLPLVDILSPSVEDVRTTFRGAAPGPDGLLDMGVAVVMLTDGPDGLALRTGSAARLGAAGVVLAGREAAWADQRHFLVPPRVPVHTTVGAGDAATAGLLHGLLAGHGPRESLELAARTAAARVRGVTLDGTAGRSPA
jgi:sugar/nucleoside kinase (ribokinase family)